jgi:hypothetical protein
MNVKEVFSEYSPEELKKGVRNPFFKHLTKTVEVAMTNTDYEYYKKLAEEKGASLTTTILWALNCFADELRADDKEEKEYEDFLEKVILKG